MEQYQVFIASSIRSVYPELELIFTTPPDANHGDIALPCFSLAKTLKKSPVLIAEELKYKLEGIDFIEKVQSVNGYLNIFIKKPVLFEDIMTEILRKRDKFGSSMSGANKKALVEHTSINPNASPHVGRARNALIGDTIVRLLRFEGYDVDVHYFVNDIGKQIAMLLLGALGKENVTFQDLLGIYVAINQKVSENPELEKDVFHLLYGLENGDKDIIESFRKLVNICIKGQTEILSELGIEYNSFDYESDFIFAKTTDYLLKELLNTGKLEEDEEGRLGTEPGGIQPSHEGPLFGLDPEGQNLPLPLRDIAYMIDKAKTNADMNIVVLGEDQKLYFRQVSSALHLLGYKAPVPVHYSFVLLAEGKMATRKGNVVLLEDFMKEASAKASEEIAKRHGAGNEKTSKAIGYGAVKYAILRASNDKNVLFDWEAALSFEGESGPYLQYSLARINSIFRKYENKLPERINYEVFNNEQELALVKELSSFPAAVRNAVKEFSPHIIAHYVYGLTKRFSSFYHDCPVLNAECEDLKIARLTLIACVRQVILNCFTLLGIEAVEIM